MRAMNNISKQLLEGNLNQNIREFISLLVEVLRMVLRTISNVKPEKPVEEEPEEKDARADSSNTLVYQQDETYPEIHNYFPTNVKPKEVIDFLIDLGNAKQFNGNFWLRFDADWYAIFKILLHRGKIKCKLQPFSEIVRRYVLPYVTDEKHRKRISCNYRNLKVISKEHPYRKYTCMEWRMKLRENPSNLILRRAVKLYNYLSPKILLNSSTI